MIAPPFLSKDATERGFGLPLCCEELTLPLHLDAPRLAQHHDPEHASVQMVGCRGHHRASSAEIRGSADWLISNAQLHGRGLANTDRGDPDLQADLMTWVNEGGRA